MWLKRSLAVAVLAICLCQFTPVGAQGAPHYWTVAIYMSGSNTLSENVQQDLDEMVDASLGGDVRVVALVDQDAYGDCKVVALEDGAWVESPTSVVNALWGVEVDMGDPATLRDFATWAFAEYPSDFRSLDLWGHGAGWAGVCMDSGSWLTMPEVESALVGLHIDLLSIDACQMGMVEVAYELRNCADVLVTSEKDVPAEGWHYGNWLEQLGADDNATAAGVALAETYMSWALNHSAYSATVAVVDLARMGSLASSLDGFSRELRASWPLLRATIISARVTTEKYDGDAEYDLAHFAQNVALRGGSPILARAAMVVEAQLKWVVVHNDAWTRAGDEPAEHANGLSIWFPSNGALPQYRELAFTVDTSWDEFLDAYSNYSVPPTHSISLATAGADSNLDGTVDEIHATLETDAPGSAVFVFECEEHYISIDTELTAGKASTTLGFADAGNYRVWAYVYDVAGTLAALASIHGRIAVEAWLYVNGTVVDEGGHPIERVLVEIGWGGGWRLNGTTDADGNYSVPVLYPTQFTNGTICAAIAGDSNQTDASGPGEVRLDLVAEGGARTNDWILPALGAIFAGAYLAILAALWLRRLPPTI